MFERLFGRKGEPKKENPMDYFKSESHEHGQYGILFGSNPNIKDLYQKALGNEISCVVIESREEEKIHNMLDCAGKSVNEVIKYQTSALTVVAVANSQDEAVMMQMGFIRYEAQGVTICPGCLQQAIFKCEEQLNALKDLQEATKEYCK